MPNRIQKNYNYYLGKDIIMEKKKKKERKIKIIQSLETKNVNLR